VKIDTEFDFLMDRGGEKHIPKANTIRITVPSKYKEVIIVPFGDIHLGNKACDLESLKKQLRWLYDTKNAYVIGMGDYVEASITNSPGLYDQSQFLNEQLETMVKLLTPLAKEGRIIGLLVGNHEHRATKATSLDITNWMCKALKVKYLGWGSLNEIKIKNHNSKKYQTYTLYAQHGASGARKRSSKLNAVINLEDIAQAEVFCMGHVHELSNNHSVRVGISDGRIINIKTHYVLTGSYLNYWQSYAHMKAMPLNIGIGSPKIKLSTVNHGVTVETRTLGEGD